MAGATRTLSHGGEEDGGGPRFEAPYLVLVFQREEPGAPSERLSIAEVDLVELRRGEGRAHRRDGEGGRPRLVLEIADRWLSSRHATLERAGSGWLLRDRGSKNGTFVGGVRVESRPLEDGDWIEAGGTFLLFRERVERGAREPADRAVEPGAPVGRIDTLYPPFALDLEALGRVAKTPLPVILEGESGAGKEVAARALHRQSGRPGAFVAVNCGALPEGLAESALFGHRKGAFSGAVDDRPGLVRASDRGTLFLDEVGELSPAAQVKLLRVLQEREVTPVGETRATPVDLRVVAATHRDLGAMVGEGVFREDLLARLAGFRLRLPALRERREDLGFLIGTLLTRVAGDRGALPGFERSAARALLEHDWPRNVRELEQALGAAFALSGGERIRLEHLPASLRSAARPAAPAAEEELGGRLARLLAEHRGNVSAVAREMGTARVQIRRWCKRFDLDPAAFRR